MLSRTADHLFWLARYIERAVSCAAGAASVEADNCPQGLSCRNHNAASAPGADRGVRGAVEVCSHA
jgi:hypothetical protein